MNFPTRYEDVNAVLQALLNGARAVLGEQLVGLYLYGSLASGDFDPRRSDLDFVVVTATALDEAQVQGLEALHTRLWQSELKWAAKLEGSYVPRALIRRHGPADGGLTLFPTVNEGQFYLAGLGTDWILQRAILRENGVVVAGADPKTLIDPVAQEVVRGAVLGFLHEWWQPMLSQPDRLRSREYQAYAVLTMCRVLYTLETGEIASKVKSARWAQQTLGAEWASLVEQALLWPDGDQPDRFKDTLSFIKLVVERAG